MTDTRALADELTHICGLDKLDDEPCGSCERCRAARILRDVVPAMEAELAAANARISALQTSVDQLDDWKADYLPVLNTVDNLEKERDESRAELAAAEAHLESLQNRYALVTAENARLQAVILDAPHMTENSTPPLKEYRRWYEQRQCALDALQEKDNGY